MVYYNYNSNVNWTAVLELNVIDVRGTALTLKDIARIHASIVQQDAAKENSLIIMKIINFE